MTVGVQRLFLAVPFAGLWSVILALKYFSWSYSLPFADRKDGVYGRSLRFQRAECCRAVVKVSNLGRRIVNSNLKSGQRLILEQVTLSALFTRPLEDEEFGFRSYYTHTPIQLLRQLGK